MLDVYLCAGEGHPRQAPFPPFIRLCSFIIPSVFPVPEMMLGICDLGHSGRNWPAQGRPCVCLLAMQRSAANSLLPPPLSMGKSKAWAWVCRRHKEMKYVKGEKKGREMDWGTCSSAGENCGKQGQTDRWAEWGEGKRNGL